VEKRDDAGPLWENFIFIERLKKRAYRRILANSFFWRTWDGQEIDCIEEGEGSVSAYEFKYGRTTPATPRSWREAYPSASYDVVDRENYLDFIT
jgi:predicted AAA+ superfamily ATPase